MQHPHLTREKLVIIADLGRMRAFQVRRRGDDPREQDHLKEVADAHFEDVGSPIRETVTDQSGRFGQHGVAGGAGGMSAGEEHNVESERERDALERLAAKIADVVEDEAADAWLLAAPQSILAALQASLPPSCRQKLTSTLGADLTKVPVAKLEERFFS